MSNPRFYMIHAIPTWTDFPTCLRLKAVGHELTLVTLTPNHLSERHPTADVASGNQMSPADRVRWAQSAMEHKVYELGASAAEVAQLETLVRFVERNPDSEMSQDIVKTLDVLNAHAGYGATKPSHLEAEILDHLYAQLERTLSPEELEQLQKE